MKDKFYLDPLNILESGTSDHSVLRAGPVVVFNILGQCKKYDTHYNNGLHIEESVQDYADRLSQKTLPVLQSLHAQGVDLFLLQEAPSLIVKPYLSPSEKAYNQTVEGFYRQLHDMMPDLHIQRGSAKGVVTLISDSSYMPDKIALSIDYSIELQKENIHNMPEQDIELDIQIAMHIDIQDVCPDIHVMEENRINIIDTTVMMQEYVSEKNHDRFQALELQDPSGIALLKIANFHGDFMNQAGTRADIDYFLNEHYLIGGDFNLLEVPQVEGFVAFQATPLDMMPVQTYDALFI